MKKSIGCTIDVLVKVLKAWVNGRGEMELSRFIVIILRRIT